MPTGKAGPLDRLEALRESIGEDDEALPFLGVVAGERDRGPGVVATLVGALTNYVDTDIDVIMHDDEADLDSIGERQTLLLMSSSSATGDRAALKNALFSQTLSALRTCAQRHGGACPVPTVLVMDEFASLGRCERLLGDIGIIRSEGITVIACWQSLTQLQAVSGYSHEEAKNLLDQLQHKVILSCGDYETAQELSHTIGDYTCEVEGSSVTKAAYGNNSVGTSHNLTGRALIKPDELMRWRAADNGHLVVTPTDNLLVRSMDISETFPGVEAHLVGPDAARTLMLEDARSRNVRNTEHPKVWRGPGDQKKDDGVGPVADVPVIPATDEAGSSLPAGF